MMPKKALVQLASRRSAVFALTCVVIAAYGYWWYADRLSSQWVELSAPRVTLRVLVARHARRPSAEIRRSSCVDEKLRLRLQHGQVDPHGSDRTDRWIFEMTSFTKRWTLPPQN